MSRGSFGRSVARAAASGGGKSYRARPALGWYLTIAAICVVGIGLIVYSRSENLKVPPKKAVEGPTASDNWTAAIGFDLCGTVQPNLPANTNLTATGLRTFGDGLIRIQPNAATSGKPANFEGAKATLALFLKNYPKIAITPTSFALPGGKTYANGAACTKLSSSATAAQKAAAAGKVRVEVWSSPTAKGRIVTGANPLNVHLTNGAMMTVGFVTASQTLPQPTSRSALLAALGQGSTTSTTVGPQPAASGATGTSGAASGTSGASGTS